MQNAINFCTWVFKVINNVFGNINGWFKINLLSLSFDKTHYVQFLTKNNQEININISYENKLITNTHSTNFLWLIIDNTIFFFFYGITVLWVWP
jgi:hypothetical protein